MCVCMRDQFLVLLNDIRSLRPMIIHTASSVLFDTSCNSHTHPQAHLCSCANTLTSVRSVERQNAFLAEFIKIVETWGGGQPREVIRNTKNKICYINGNLLHSTR
jgi:hypothetical protein